MMTVICFLPSYITWMGAYLLFKVASYYLRCGFRDLHSLMSDDTQLVNQLALHKTCIFASVIIDRRFGWHSMGIYRSQHGHVHIWYVFCYLRFAREPWRLWNNGIFFITHLGSCPNGHHCNVQYLHQHPGKLMYTRRYHTDTRLQYQNGPTFRPGDVFHDGMNTWHITRIATHTHPYACKILFVWQQSFLWNRQRRT